MWSSKSAPAGFHALSLRRYGSRPASASADETTDFVVAVGSDQQHVSHVRIGNQALQQLQRRRVHPLQIVEKQRQRMLRRREGAEETPEHQLEKASRLLRWQFCHG